MGRRIFEVTTRGIAELIKVRIGLMRKETHGTTAFCHIMEWDDIEKQIAKVRVTVINEKAIFDDKFEITIRKIPLPTLVGEGEYYE